MRPRKTENRDLPPNVYRRKRKRKSGKVWIGYYYQTPSGKEISLGTDFDLARLKWAELESQEKPLDLRTMKGIFARYVRDILPKKAPRTQKDNFAELRKLSAVFDDAPIDAITPAMIAQYRDRRSAKTRANREIALLSHIFNTAREWGLTEKANPCLGIRKNKERPRDYYATDAVWAAVYVEAVPELKEAMDLAYLTGQRPADVLAMRQDDIDGDFLLVKQGKTGKRLRILLKMDGQLNSLGLLIERMIERNKKHISLHFILNQYGKRVSQEMLRNRWDDARETARLKAIAGKQSEFAAQIARFQFRDIRPKAASEIVSVADASLLLGHSEEGITERVYRRVGAIAKPAK